MDEPDTPSSPRKKLKAHHSPRQLATSGVPMSDPASVQSREWDDKEAQCGILEYASLDISGFTGILKKRYTDFLVNEILPSGQVIHLDNLKKPSKQTQLSQVAPVASQPRGSEPSHFPVSSNAGPSASLDENARPIFESTNLNKFEESSRKREKVFMRRDSNSLSIVDDYKKEKSPNGKGVAAAEEHEGTEPCTKASVVTSPATQESVIANHGEVIAEESNERPKPAEKDGSSNSKFSVGSVAGWQTYAGSDSVGLNAQISPKDRIILESYFDTETVEQTIALYSRVISAPNRRVRGNDTVKSRPIERDVRTQIHQEIRRIFSSRLETTTDDNGCLLIWVATSSGRSGRDQENRNNGYRKPQEPRGKAGWAQKGGDYLHFSIYKENKDTMEVISYLAKVLKLRPQLFRFAGTKDRRGVTVQRASVYRVGVERMIEVGRSLRNAKIGNFEYHPQGLQLGDLTGNEFVITLRDCQFQFDNTLDLDAKVKRASSHMNDAVEKLTSRGFINYYGLQRFGAFTSGTHIVGRSMLQGDYKAACDTILEVHPSALAAAQSESADTDVSRDDIARASALHSFATTGRLHPAIEELPRKFSAEACLIRHLSRPDFRNDYQGALQAINRNLRLMYVHAYQSLVWNTAASARWKKYRDRILPGDLVLVDEYPDPTSHQESPTKTVEMVDQDGEPILAADPSDRATTMDDIFTRARVIKEADLEFPPPEGKKPITIFDIVLPTPGYDIVYPANDTADIYKEFMASEQGGGLDPFDMRRKWKDVSLSGSYRKLLAKPMGKVEWDIRAYGMKGDDEQFVETDLDRIEKGKTMGQGGGNGERMATTAQSGNGNGTRNGKTAEETAEPAKDEKVAVGDTAPHPPEPFAPLDMIADPTPTHTNKPQNDKLALILKLQLGSSTYATMALRELMKKGGVQTWKAEYAGGR